MKEELLKFCRDQVNERAERLKKNSDSLQESLNSETKSSAGDKHETGRAMVQLEQEKLAQQIQELESARETLKKIDLDRNSDKIGLGSLVQTSLATYYISISAGVFQQNGRTVYCISAGSPIAQLLIGKEQGEAFVFNGKSQTILEVI